MSDRTGESESKTVFVAVDIVIVDIQFSQMTSCTRMNANLSGKTDYSEAV